MNSANVERGASAVAGAGVICGWGGQTHGQEKGFSEGQSLLAKFRGLDDCPAKNLKTKKEIPHFL